jgi:hypothetical protein
MANGQVIPPQLDHEEKAASTALQIAPVETSAMVLAAQAKALVEARYVMAMKRPRDLDEVREALLKECRRPGFASVARYHKPIGKGIDGPSIRFAEAAIRCMKNVTVETITVYDDREKRIMRVTVTDLENNIPYSQDVTVQKTVERKKTQSGDVIIRQRLNSYGEPVYLIEATDDDILNKQNALVSKAVRTLGLRLVPGDLIDEAMDMVMAVQRKKDAEDPDAAKKRLLDAFSEKGVTVAQIKDYLGHGVETLEPKELTDLRGLYAALRDGETTWREIMDASKGETSDKPADEKPAGNRTEAVLNKLNNKTAAGSAEKAASTNSR